VADTPYLKHLKDKVSHYRDQEDKQGEVMRIQHRFQIMGHAKKRFPERVQKGMKENRENVDYRTQAVKS
jgi:hypothetical protein